MRKQEWLLRYLSPIADFIGILGALFALAALRKTRQVQQELQREQQRQNKQVTVVLHHGTDRLELPVQIRRAELTRAEILGHIGMLMMKPPGARFSLGYLSSPEFFRQLSLIVASSDDATLTIPCKKEEFEQFDL